jgi:nucleotide-binding universal stress UspA family protein
MAHVGSAPVPVGRPAPARAPATVGVHAAVSLGTDLASPLVFVYVRRGPSSTLGEPYYQRRLDAEMASGRRALTDALAVAEEAGVPATGEQLAGDPARRVVEFARLRAARLVVLGSRQRRLRRGVARGVIRRTDRPVLVAGGTASAT